MLLFAWESGFKPLLCQYFCNQNIRFPRLMGENYARRELQNFRGTIKRAWWTRNDWHMFFFIWFVRLLALRPLLAYCASLGW
jgi:hypothetical protein